jgi:Abortive infection alpha
MDESKTRMIKAVSEVLPVKDAYVDVIQPAARETGTALGQVASTINSALRPLRSIQITWGLLFDRLDGWLNAKLKDTPPEQIVEPPPTIVGGVVAGLLFAGDEPDLRELFVQLLATSMVATTQTLAHPAFAEALKQLTPVEARLVLELASQGSIPYVLIRSHVRRAGNDYSHWVDATQASDDAEVQAIFDGYRYGGWNQEIRLTSIDVQQEAFPSLSIAGFQNLARLGIVALDEARFIDDWAPYCRIARSTAALKAYAHIRSCDRLPSLSRATIMTTEYGEQFLAACVSRAKPA